MNDPSITIETSCGKVFEVRVSELSDTQLTTLLAGNGERADAYPTHIAAMREELQRREEAKATPTYVRTNTHRDLARERLVDVIYRSIGGSPWTDEFEEGLETFFARLNWAIDSVPDVAEVFDKPLTGDASGCGGINTIGPLPF
jgi:hypothetical protein